MSHHFTAAVFTGLSAAMIWRGWFESPNGWRLALAIWLSGLCAFGVWMGVDSVRDAKKRALANERRSQGT